MTTDSLDSILNRIEASFDCGACTPSELAKYLRKPPERVSEWIRQRKPRPGGDIALKLQQWASDMTLRIAAGGRKLQMEYRHCYVAVCDKRFPVAGKD